MADSTSNKSKTTVYLVGNTVQSFDPSVKGVDPLTPSGTEVPNDKLEEVRAQAHASGVRLS